MLFNEGSIGNLKIKNRFIMPAIVTDLAENGYVSPQLVGFLEERAKGGVGMVMAEAAWVKPWQPITAHVICIHEDKYIDKLSELAQTVKKHDSRVGIQINHLDERIVQAPIAGRLSVMKSFISGLSKQEIQDIIQQFSKAAIRVQQAGFDAIEIHGAHGCTLSQFLSSATNNRSDEYGGSIENRVRLVEQILDQVKKAVGKGFPLIVRINVNDYVEGGNTADEAREIALKLQKAGADAISLSAGIEFINAHHIAPPSLFPPAWLLNDATKIKAYVQIPIIIAGRIQDVSLAEQILNQGKADFIAIGRGLIADPLLPEKARHGSYADIRKCIACDTCLSRIESGENIRCLVNPVAGREHEYRSSPVKTRRKILIVGGGLAGLEAARVASLRGHDVTICEKEIHLGGQWVLACKAPGKQEFSYLIEFLNNQLLKTGVNINLGHNIDPEYVRNFSPDALIVAVGAVPIIRPLPGPASIKSVQALDVLAGASIKGKAVVLGGGLIGIEVAEFLAHKGTPVSIVSRRQRIGDDMLRIMRWLTMSKFKELDISVYTDSNLKAVNPTGIVIDRLGKELHVQADTLVIAGGMQSLSDVAESLRNVVSETYLVGDCLTPRNGFYAMIEGSDVGNRV